MLHLLWMAIFGPNYRSAGKAGHASRKRSRRHLDYDGARYRRISAWPLGC